MVESGRVEISAVWPHQRMYLGINPDLIEDGHIAQGPEELASEDWLEANALHRIVRVRYKVPRSEMT
jgi:hypothetical protein